MTARHAPVAAALLAVDRASPAAVGRAARRVGARVPLLRAPVLACVLVLLAGARAPADLVTFTNGKSARATVFREGPRLRVNPFRSSLAAMTWGVLTHAPGDVKSVAPEDGLPELFAALDALAPADAGGRANLLARAVRARAKALSRRVADEILALQPSHEQALREAGGAEAFAARRRGDPDLDAGLAAEVRRLLALPAGADRRKAAERLVVERGLQLSPEALERMARSSREDRGLLAAVPIRLDAARHPGGTYAAFVPEDLDPLVARPLLLALHGGGPAGAKSDVVVGSGAEASSLFLEGARRAGVIVVAPTAREWPWNTSANEDWLLAVLDEAAIRWNVDLDRVHVAGQGEGGDAALWLASRHAARFATVGAAGARPVLAPSLAARGVGVWLYQGEDDEVVPTEDVRKVAALLKKADADFVYTELPTLGRGFPPQAEEDYWRFAAPRRRVRARSAWPRASAAEPATPAETAAFGSPAGAWGADVASPLKALKEGLMEAEAAARMLAREAPEGIVAEASAVVRDRTVPREGRAWAAWLIGERRDPAGLPALGDAVRAETDVWLVGFFARALRRLGSPDATEDLRAALRDLTDRFRRRAWPGGLVPAFEYDRVCRTAADLVEALGSVAGGGAAGSSDGGGTGNEVAVDLEATAVVGILRDVRKVGGAGGAAADPSAARARLALALGRAYRALGAEPTLFDMLRVTLKADPVAAQAAVRGATEGLPRDR